MGIRTKSCAVALAMLMVASDALAASNCATADELAAPFVAVLQEELMVAGLTCANGLDNFNAFQERYKGELVKLDGVLLEDFKHVYGADQGDTKYHHFKTLTADLADQKSYGAEYCGVADTIFKAALAANKPTLASLIASFDIIAAFHVGSNASQQVLEVLHACEQK